MGSTNAPRSAFASALAEIAKDRKLEPSVILDSIKQAILAAFKKDHPDKYKEDSDYVVSLDSVSGEAVILEGKTDVTPPGFGRIAAQTAKQVILQKIREAEKGVIISEYEQKLGTLVNGLIIRQINGEWIVDLGGKVEAVMSAHEQVYSENYRINQKMVFYVHSIRDSIRGKEIIVSRADTGLIKELFRREVPEVASNAVEIKAVARDPGSRTKIAVFSAQPGIDAVGSCVGQKGVRVQAVINEINGEKLDIVQYNENIESFVAAALSPATGLKVKVNKERKNAEVTAPTDQLSLAIGRDGQNAKLAGRLTDLHIDIKGEVAVADNDQ